MDYRLSLDLQQRQAQTLKQMQRLIMSPQMQQAIHLLQMPVMELVAAVDLELQKNPILEYIEDEEEEGEGAETESKEDPDQKELTFDDRDFEILRNIEEEFQEHFAQAENFKPKRTTEEEKWQSYLEQSIQDEPSLFEYLMRQAQEAFSHDEDKRVAEMIIGSLDAQGFFQTPLSEIATMTGESEEKIQEILFKIQEFEPFGIGAADLREALLIQLRCMGKENTPAYEIVEKHFDDLLHNRIPAIQKEMQCSLKEISEIVEKHISNLSFHPGRAYSYERVQAITPDVIIRIEEDDRLVVAVNDDSLPPLKLNRRYLNMLNDEKTPHEAKDFIRRKLFSAKWLIKNIMQRNDTLERITTALTVHQKEFFLQPQGKLSPLTMQELADELGLHESTIARAVANKYVYSPRGLHPLRSFFTNAMANAEGQQISSQTVRDALLELIENEDKKHPLSDEALAAKLKEKGIECARRTVAKYRMLLKFGNTRQRRKFS